AKEAGTRLMVARTGSKSSCKQSPAKTAESDELTVLEYKIADVLSAKQDMVMQPGDIVSVLDADFIYVYGSVNKQGRIEIKEPLTLTQALATAEGLESAANKGKVRVLRQKPGSSEREEFVYNLKDIMGRKAVDPILEPNDIVAVSEDKIKSILNTVGKTLTQGLPNVIPIYRVPGT
ncbi:MAG: hypothetical protein ABR535_02980, partial [Pyrinomonadaceae bacterium]